MKNEIIILIIIFSSINVYSINYEYSKYKDINLKSYKISSKVVIVNNYLYEVSSYAKVDKYSVINSDKPKRLKIPIDGISKILDLCFISNNEFIILTKEKKHYNLVKWNELKNVTKKICKINRIQVQKIFYDKCKDVVYLFDKDSHYYTYNFSSLSVKNDAQNIFVENDYFIRLYNYKDINIEIKNLKNDYQIFLSLSDLVDDDYEVDLLGFTKDKKILLYLFSIVDSRVNSKIIAVDMKKRTSTVLKNTKNRRYYYSNGYIATYRKNNDGIYVCRLYEYK